MLQAPERLDVTRECHNLSPCDADCFFGGEFSYSLYCCGRDYRPSSALYAFHFMSCAAYASAPMGGRGLGFVFLRTVFALRWLLFPDMLFVASLFSTDCVRIFRMTPPSSCLEMSTVLYYVSLSPAGFRFDFQCLAMVIGYWLLADMPPPVATLCSSCAQRFGCASFLPL